MRAYFNRRSIPNSWKVPVTIPMFELLSYMSDEDARKADKCYTNVKIVLHFRYEPADPSVGIPNETMEFEGDWSLPLIGNYPSYIKDAINKYIDDIDVDDRYGDVAYDQLDCYVESRMNPDL